MKQELAKRKDVAIRAAKAAGQISMFNFGKRLKVTSKGDRDLVTDVDKKAEDAVIKLIKRSFPSDDILGEESRYNSTGSQMRWIIDPLDGTHNFIRHIENFGTSLALECCAEVVLGVIYMPWADELYLAQKGKGAFRNGRRICVSRKKLKDTTIVYDSSIRINKKPMLKKLDLLADRVFNIRMFGSTVRSLSYLAEGTIDIEVEFNDKVWDYAAGLLLVEEAGGKCTDFQGKRWNTQTKEYIASNAIVHKELVKILSLK